MGNIRRINRNMGNKIALANANMSINGCQVFVGHKNPDKAVSAAKLFGKEFAGVLARSKVPNVTDIYDASLDVGIKIGNGSLWN